MEIEIECISAITLVTQDMSSMVNFYRDLGFVLVHGGEKADFTSYRVGPQRLNISAESCDAPRSCVRVIFYVSDVDSFYQRCLNRGIAPEFAPRDAPWSERYFHVIDPDGHELSFARPLSS